MEDGRWQVVIFPAQRILTLAILYGESIDQGTLYRIRQDLSIENNPLSLPTSKELILALSKPYQELCLECLTQTGYGQSLEFMIGCSSCGTFGAQYKLCLLGYQLGLETEGMDRRVLMQWCYQCLRIR
jgi:hypothetical protein